jgi:hypothetical protein
MPPTIEEKKMATVTCHTEGCGNEGIGLDLDLDYVDPESGETVAISTVVCGVCGKPITDLGGTG